ncbi:MAG TPA: glycosyltransferase family 4 protein [Gemmatimonadaceae bacterium]|nr:glycosyltransferase family 4 protein [Gemmatimonadaceae bacterium]
MSKSIRVAMISHGYFPRVGGAERQLAALAPVLRQRGIDVHVLTRRDPGLKPFEIVAGVPVHRLPVPRPKPVASLAFTLAALPLLHRLRPDVIHAHELFSPATTALLGKRWLRTPVVATAHRSGELGDVFRIERKPFGTRRLRLLRENVDVFVTISQEIDRELDTVGIPSDRRAFISNGVDTQRFSPLPPAERSTQRALLGLPDAPTAVFTGRLAPEKRVKHLIAVWPAVRAAVPNATLLVLGAGEMDQELKAAAGEGVRFLGAVDDVAPYLQCADLFVLPSMAEGLSVSLLEAMSTGLASIATAVGGTPEVIDDRANGWLIEPDNRTELRDALLTLFRETDLRNELGRQGRQRVLDRYSVDSVGSRLQQLYERLVERGAVAVTTS